MTKVLLVRHGETKLNKQGRVQGWLPEPLSKYGEKQARLTGEYINNEFDVSRVVSSDLHRAEQTAEIIAQQTGVSLVETDNRWREQNFGVHEGRDSDEFDEIIADISPSEKLEGGEALTDVRQRAEKAFTEVSHRNEEVIVVVSHCVTITQLLASIAGYGLEEAFTVFDPDNAAMAELDTTIPRQAGIVRTNVTPTKNTGMSPVEPFEPTQIST